MNQTCPNCGADNEVAGPGREAVCLSCFHAWVVGEGGPGEGSGDSSDPFALGPGDADPPGEDDGGGALAMGAGPPAEADDGGAIPLAGAEGDASPEVTGNSDDDRGEELFFLDDEDIELLDDEDVEAAHGPEEVFELPIGAEEETTGDLPAEPGVEFGEASSEEATRVDGRPQEDEPADSPPAGPASFLFKRRRKRNLSETDVAKIGTYQRRSNELPQAEEVVWKPGEAPPPKRASEVTRDNPHLGEPFDSTEVLGGDGPGPSDSQPPGGRADSTLAWGADPTAGDRGTDYAGDDPFADVGGQKPGASETLAFGEEPSLGASDDPFAPYGEGDDDDPFASDPFGTSDGAPSRGGLNVTEENPFDTADFTTAGETSGMESLDFADLDDGPPGPAQPEAPDDNTVFVDGVGPVRLGGDKETTSPTTGDGDALFELDMPTGEGHPGGGGGRAAASPAKAAQQRRRKKRGRSRKRRGQAGRVAALVVLVVALAGVALGQTDLGYFGVNALVGAPEPAAPKAAPVQPERPEAEQEEDEARAALTSDAPGDYTARIADLREEIKASPGDTGVREKLVRTLMRLQERYPAVYRSDPTYPNLLEELLTPSQLEQDKRLLISKLLAENKTEDAAEALEQYVAEMTHDPDDLYLMARVARSRGNEERAIQYYERAIEQAPGYEPALFDLGDLFLAREKIPEAQETFEKLLEKNPKHSGAKLALAQITLYEKGYDKAKALIDEALAMARQTDNPEEQFRAFWLKATLAEAQGNAEDKRKALQRALEIRPDDERTALALAQLLGQQGLHQEALRRLKECQKAGCNSSQFYTALVDAYEQNGQPEDARSQLNEALRKHPNDTGLLMLHAEKEREAEHYKTAKNIYATILEKDPTYIDSYLELADLQLREGRQSEAVETLQEGAERVDNELPLLERLAETQMKVGATLKAKETMGRILEMDPNNTDAKLRFAELLAGLGFYEESSGYYGDLDVAGALNGEQLLDYAEVLFELKRLDEAMKHVQAVLSADPLDLRATVLRGAVHSARGAYDKADEDLRKALKLDSENADAYYYLGLNEMNRGRMAGAVEHLSKAATLAPEDLDIRYHLARAYTEVGGVDNRRMALAQYSFIIDEYEKYTSNLDKKRIDPEIYLMRGRLYFDNSQFREALADFKQAMLLDPVRQDLIIEFAKTLQTMGKRSEAETYLEEVLSRDAKNPAAHFHLGVIKLKSGDKNKAEDHFKQAIAAGGANFPVAHRYLGFLYKDKGLTALSCNAFKEYLRVAPRDAYDREEIRRLVGQTCR
ncbi:MAG: tetratricopeptide repeat protein [Myxococcota bacterium]